MKRWWKILLAATVAATFAVAVAAAAVLHWHETPLSGPERAVVVLEPGEPFARFAERLHRRGIVAQPRLLTWYARLTGAAHRVQAGEYEVLRADSPASLLSKLVTGRVVSYRVKLVEGWTVMQALAALQAHPALDHRLAGATEHTLLDMLGLPGGYAEGLFFPDTYQFVRGDSDADVMRRAYARMARVLDEAWRNRADDLPYETPYEALIVASLIEKETGRDVDRPHISQVFALRLKRGMRLQTDPTVIYGLGNTFDGNLRRVDLRRSGPYNTYLNRGLPPTPIALPGAASIQAAMHPADGKYLYFVSRGDGSSQFSESLDEHEAAVERYQLGRRAAGSGRDG